MRNEAVSILCAVLLSTVEAANAQSLPSGVHVGVTVAQLNYEFGSAIHTFDTGQTITRPATGGRDGSSIALELSVPVRDWLAVSLATYSSADNSTFEDWIPDPPIVQPPTGPSIPNSVGVFAHTEFRMTMLTASMFHHPAPNVQLFGRIGAAFTKSELEISLSDNGARIDRFSESDVKPWIGAGVRYMFFRGMSMDAEFGVGSDSLRTARLGFGWTF